MIVYCATETHLLNLFSTRRIFSREVNFFELTHTQFDSYGRNVFVVSFSRREKVSSNSFYIFVVEKIRFARKNLPSGKPVETIFLQASFAVKEIFRAGRNAIVYDRNVTLLLNIN